MLEITPIKAFNDNYLWLFRQPGSRQAAIVDPGDAKPVLAYLQEQGLHLVAILITHHHGDHIGGVNELLAHYQVPVYGPASQKIPQVTEVLRDGDEVAVCGATFRVLEIPGHTLDHIAYCSTQPQYRDSPVLFCGDTLFAGGCGRVFEGTHAMMHASLQKLAALDPATHFFCAHEYTLSNLKFAQAVSPEDYALMARVREEQSKRLQDQPTVPATIGLELKTNPFLRCGDEAIVRAAEQELGRKLSTSDKVFGAIREWKDRF